MNLKIIIVVPSKLGRQNASLIIFKHYQHMKHKLHVFKSATCSSRILSYFCSFFHIQKSLSLVSYRFQKLSKGIDCRRYFDFRFTHYK